jgi:pyrimidine operon attenuation protein/uracil phosphoribosyltransferase
MNTTDVRQAPTGDLAFFVKSQLLTADDVQRALRRMAHEIIEKNPSLSNLTIVGLQRGGVPFAEELAHLLESFSDQNISFGTLDVSGFRDDVDRNPHIVAGDTQIPGDLDGRTVVLVDDVLFTGRTIRAALNALGAFGRPKSIQLVVMVDRGHRELPIRPDHVGKNLPTSMDEDIVATLDGVWIGTKGAGK